MNAQIRFARSIIHSSNSAAALSASHFYAAQQRLEGKLALAASEAEAYGAIATATEADDENEYMRCGILFGGGAALKAQANLSRGLVLELIA